VKVAETNRVVRRLRAEGYQVTQPKRGGHWTVRAADGTWIHSLSSSASSRRAEVELRAALRRHERGAALAA
jgi:hypothetical protein